MSESAVESIPVAKKVKLNSATPKVEKKSVESEQVVYAEELKRIEAVAPVKMQSGYIARPVGGGYEVVDSGADRVLFRIRATRFGGVYLIEGRSGILYNYDNTWVVEEIVDGKIERRTIDLSF